ncbi:MAG TPA: hypothetical protein VF432_29485 [Thermoanaerobaculia bacterium]
MNVEEVLDRARSQIGRGIRYKLGKGTFRASRHSCADANNQSDCSAFLCWALGLDKVGNYPWLATPGKPRDPDGEWYGTDNIVNDALNANVGHFTRIATPLVGSIVVFPTRWKNGKASPPGHCGIITELKANGEAKRVIHCSSSNFKTTGDAVQETDTAFFDANPKTIHAWYSGMEVGGGGSAAAKVMAATLSALQAPVRFCIVASGADRNAIEAIARPLAALNPVGRRVVVPGDSDYPDDASIAQWVAGTANPGAVVLRPNGTVYTVLNVDRASHGAWVEDAFANGRL